MAFMAHSDGRASSKGQGNTGAPGDEVFNGSLRTCQTCHSSGTDFQVTLGIDIKDSNGSSVTSYVPGDTYDVTVTLTPSGGTPNGYGFQIVSLKAPIGQDGADVAGFSDASSNAQIAIADNGRQYAEQDDISSSNEFTVKWTAPSAGSGPISFYSCGNAVNNNGMNSGDAAAIDQLQLDELTVSTSDLSSDVKLQVFPNPVKEQLNLTINSEVTGNFQADLFDVQGKLLQNKQLFLTTGASQHQFEVSDLSQGIYSLRLSDGARHTTIQVVKE